ncbi:MAG: biopolymer transporter ExbD [Pseudomonadota bacterium]
MAVSVFTRKQKQAVEFNIAPLLDMVFILLIFFVVTTTFVRETGIEIKKPKATSANEVVSKHVLIGVSQEGTIHMYENQIDLYSLKSILKNVVSDNPEIKIVIVSDRQAPSGVIVDILDECNLAGVNDVAISAMKEE